MLISWDGDNVCWGVLISWDGDNVCWGVLISWDGDNVRWGVLISWDRDNVRFSPACILWESCFTSSVSWLFSSLASAQ